MRYFWTMGSIYVCLAMGDLFDSLGFSWILFVSFMKLLARNLTAWGFLEQQGWRALRRFLLWWPNG